MKASLVLLLGVAHARNAEREAMVNEINSKPGVLWKAGFNKNFEELPVGASASLCGVLPHSEKELLAHAVLPPKNFAKMATAIPTSFDAAQNWPQCANVINDVRDQSNCGCCWAFGAASAASDRICIYTNGTKMLPISAEATCFCAESNGCGGGTLFTPWSYFLNRGAVTGGNQNATGPLGGGFCSAFSLPHCHHHGPVGNDPYPPEGTPACPSQRSPACKSTCDGDAKSPHNVYASDKWGFMGSVTTYRTVPDIQTAIMSQGPVECAFTVYSDFENYESGIYHHVSGSALGGHAVRIVGWGTESGQDYWKVANSWNPYWGEKGYFRIRRGNNEVGIESQVTANGPNDKWGPK